MRRPTPVISRIPFNCVVLASFIAVSLAGSALAGSPLVSVSAPPGFITNDGQEAVYTLTLSAPASRNIGLNFVMTGSALQGFEYVLLGQFNKTGQIVIPAGQTSATVTLHTLSDDPTLFQEIATLNILNGTRYHIGFPNHASIRIRTAP
jgi:hypothetical protein